MSKRAKAKKVKKFGTETYRANWRFGIANHLGGIWTCETFENEERAAEYLDSQRKLFKPGALDRHNVVPVRVTLSLRRSVQSSSRETQK